MDILTSHAFIKQDSFFIVVESKIVESHYFEIFSSELHGKNELPYN